MSGFLGFLKTILVPALVSLIVYLLLTHLVLPFVRRHRHRYNQYLPVQGGLDSISSGTSSLRQRASDALYAFFVPSSWRRRHAVVDGSYASDNHEDELFDDEEGEGMVGFDIDERRREALERRRSGVGEEDRRLSRDLEEGFKDDSDDEGDTTPRNSR
ncbi:uncharacterized protein BDZ99DRAFT_281292 [Mytilinidion resinicola]|uniref:Uncharacterized protein n=1 Tax=Mytilinidion resinicola TaxID=574789 RepID=A0A6A6YST7_9PEZI|nr:uncharacterized protein BDZ99DRAFT_281292 [Mytilinidion resinicola]KAF2811831.1 hypothetical protein BDZ99DRAFT_281292 [Mytilinidion resinicola]